MEAREALGIAASLRRMNAPATGDSIEERRTAVVLALADALLAERQEWRVAQRQLRSWLGENLPGRVWDERVRGLLAAVPIVAGGE
jgi:hypothetical protein